MQLKTKEPSQEKKNISNTQKTPVRTHLSPRAYFTFTSFVSYVTSKETIVDVDINAVHCHIQRPAADQCVPEARRIRIWFLWKDLCKICHPLFTDNKTSYDEQVRLRTNRLFRRYYWHVEVKKSPGLKSSHVSEVLVSRRSIYIYIYIYIYIDFHLYFLH